MPTNSFQDNIAAEVSALLHSRGIANTRAVVEGKSETRLRIDFENTTVWLYSDGAALEDPETDKRLEVYDYDSLKELGADLVRAVHSHLDKISYRQIDPTIIDWANRNHLVLHRSFSGRECRVVYLSSKAGACFQISIDPPHLDSIRAYIFIVEGDGVEKFEPLKVFDTRTADFPKTLDKLFEQVLSEMSPSERYLPNKLDLFFARVRRKFCGDIR